MTMQIGLLGAGNISRTHARAVREIPGVQLAAIWGPDPRKAALLASEVGGTAYESYERFLDDRSLNLVIVGTPSGLHAEHAVDAAERGLHVLVEKPLDVSTAKIDELIGACDGFDVKLGVIFQDRTAPDLRWLKRAIGANALGEILLVSARAKWYRPPEYYAASTWRGTWALDGGGALMNQGIHTVDLLLWLLGDVSRVSAATRTGLHAIEVEDTAVACLEFASGAVGTLEVTTAAYPGYARRVEITGTLGTVVVEGDRVVAADLSVAPPETPPRDEGNTNASASSPVVTDIRGHRLVIEDFVAAIECGDAPLCDGREGRRSVALVEAIYAAAASPNAGRTAAPRPLRADTR